MRAERKNRAEFWFNQKLQETAERKKRKTGIGAFKLRCDFKHLDQDKLTFLVLHNVRAPSVLSYFRNALLNYIEYRWQGQTQETVASLWT